MVSLYRGTGNQSTDPVDLPRRGAVFIAHRGHLGQRHAVGVKGTPTVVVQFVRDVREFRGQQPAKNAERKSKKSWELVTPSALKSALAAKKSVMNSKKSCELMTRSPF